MKATQEQINALESLYRRASDDWDSVKHCHDYTADEAAAIEEQFAQVRWLLYQLKHAGPSLWWTAVAGIVMALLVWKVLERLCT